MVPDLWATKRRDDHTFWYCPNGHEQHFPEGGSEAEKLKLERDRLARIAKRDVADLVPFSALRPLMERVPHNGR